MTADGFLGIPFGEFGFADGVEAEGFPGSGRADDEADLVVGGDPFEGRYVKFCDT